MQILNHIITQTDLIGINITVIITSIVLFVMYLHDKAILDKGEEEIKRYLQTSTANQDIKDEIEKLKSDILNLTNKNTVNDADIKDRLHKLEQQLNPSKRTRYGK